MCIIGVKDIVMEYILLLIMLSLGIALVTKLCQVVRHIATYRPSKKYEDKDND